LKFEPLITSTDKPSRYASVLLRVEAASSLFCCIPYLYQPATTKVPCDKGVGLGVQPIVMVRSLMNVGHHDKLGVGQEFRV